MSVQYPKVVGLTVNTDTFSLSALVTQNTKKDAYPCLKGRFKVGRQVKKFPGVNICVNDI